MARRFSACAIGLISVVPFLVVAYGPMAFPAEGPAPGSGKRLPRMYDGAPPQIPHSIVGLEGACLGCHLEGVQGATIVPHPDRPSCRQCHVPQDPSVQPLVKNTFGTSKAAGRR